MTIRIKTIALVLGLSFVAFSCKKDELSSPEPKVLTVYSTLQQHEDLSLFTEAIEMAGLQDVYNQGGLTLFAPTDSSFKVYLKDIGADSLTGLYNLYGEATFKNLLKYHLLEKKVKAMDVVSSYVATSATNSNGNQLHAYVSSIDKRISLNSYAATITTSDIEAGDGIIHKVNGVLTPLTLSGLIRVNPNLSKMKTAISKSQDNLELLLNQDNQMHTIFCPNDAAVNAFLSDTGYYDWNAFTSANGNVALSELLKYHVLRNDNRAQNLQTAEYMTLFSGHSFEIIKDNSGTVKIKDEQDSQPRASVITTDITAVNGSIHIIDKLLRHN